MLVIEERGQKFRTRTSYEFLSTKVSILFSFHYCSFSRLKHPFAIMKIIQCSIFQRNTVLLEITQNKQNPSTIEFLLSPY